MAAKTWICQRQSGGVKCGAVNAKRLQICPRCGKRRPATKKPAHTKALKIPYEIYVIVNGGEHCGVCGAQPSEGRRLDRDHEHKGDGLVRGLLCWRHNALLSNNDWTPELLRAAADYLERAEQRRG